MSGADPTDPLADDAKTLARIRDILGAQAEDPQATLDAIARIIRRREAPAAIYQKPWG